MSYAHSKPSVISLGEDIIPTAIIVKNIPFDWTQDHVLYLMSKMKLPIPRALNYLYDTFHPFRCMAFATFRSSEETQQVVRRLHGQSASGCRLNVQYKRKRPEIVAVAVSSSRDSLQPNLDPHLEVQEKTNASPQRKVPLATKVARDQTSSSESYDLLLQYQTEPVEKEKLRKFLARTGDYQEAVNEFAKNRVRESEEGGYLTSMEIPPILEMRPATPGELEEIAEMESRFGLGGEAHAIGSQSIRTGRDLGVMNVMKDSMSETIKLASHDGKDKKGSADHELSLDEGTDKGVHERQRFEDGHEKQGGRSGGPTKSGDQSVSDELLCIG